MKLASFLIPIILITITAAVISCSKSNNGSKPTIKIKSINTLIPQGGGLNVIFDFTSSSADLARGNFTAIRIRQNQIPLPPGSNSVDTLPWPIPDFTDVTKGQFQYQLDYNYLHQSDQENDTVIFKFSCVDRAGNKSDTVTSPKIVIETP